MVSIRQNTKIGAVENGYKLLSRSPSGNAVIREVHRDIPKYNQHSATTGELLAEEGIHILGRGVLKVSLEQKQGLIQAYNNSPGTIIVEAVTFADGGTSLRLDPFHMIQTLCTLKVSLRGNLTYTFQETILNFGGSAETEDSSLLDTRNLPWVVPNPAFNRNLNTGAYLVGTGDNYYVRSPYPGEPLPITWHFWNNGDRPNPIRAQDIGDDYHWFNKTANTYTDNKDEAFITIQKNEIYRVTYRQTSNSDADIIRSRFSVANPPPNIYVVERLFTGVGDDEKERDCCIYRGPVFPNDNSIHLFQLVGSPTYEDGLYMRDANGDWVL